MFINIGKMGEIDLHLKGYRCERCGHEWIPRKKDMPIPTICPKCKSPYWNKPKKIKEEDDGTS